MIIIKKKGDMPHSIDPETKVYLVNISYALLH